MSGGDVSCNTIDTALHKVGIIDSNNNVVIPLLYDVGCRGQWIKNHRTGAQYFLGRRNGKTGLIDAQQSIVLNFEYDRLELADTTSIYFRSFKNGKYGVIALDGKRILPSEFEDLNYYPPGIWVAIKQGAYGVYDGAGNVLVPHKYQHIRVYPDSLEVMLGGKYATTDMRGNVCTAFRPKEWPGPMDLYGGSFCGGVKLTPPDPANLVVHNGKLTHNFEIDGQSWYSMKNLSRYSVDAVQELLYMAHRGSPYQNDWPPHVALVDTSLKLRSAVFTDWISRIIGDYLEICLGHGMALFDTGGKRITDTINRELKGYIINASGEMLLVTRVGYPTFELESNAYHDRDRYEEPYERRHKLLKGDTVVTAQGVPLPQFYKYNAIWYIPMEARKLMGRMDVFFARDKDGYVGLTDADGNVVFPAISFKYKTMDIVHGNDLGDIKTHTVKKRLPSLQGCFVVTDDSGKRGYFTKEGRAPLPDLNFQYKNEPSQISEHVFCVRENAPARTQHTYKIINSRNISITPAIRLISVAGCARYPGLYELGVSSGHQSSFTLYMSEKGLLYADGLK